MQSAQKPERRFLEFRADAGGIAGVLLRYGDVASFGQFRERFEPRALAIGSDVVANLMHDRAKPVARTGAGLVVTDTGVALEARIAWPDTVYAREAKELVEARILRGFSIEFVAEAERFEDRTRIISGARLTGLGIVDRPAYPDSVIAERMAAAYTLALRGQRRLRRYI